MKKGRFFKEKEGTLDILVTRETFRTLSLDKKCLVCSGATYCVYAEKYLKFKGGTTAIFGIRIYGYECDVCKIGFTEQEPDSFTPSW